MLHPRDHYQPPFYGGNPHPGMPHPRSRLSSQQAARSQPPQSRVRAVQQSPQPTGRRRDRGHHKALLAGSAMAVLALLAFVPAQLKPQASRFNAGYTGAGDTGLCQEVIQSGAELSRDQLSRLLAIPERSSKQAVRRIVLEPYCLLQPISVREGAESEREAYPLAFDPSTWFVVLYEGDEYAGYDFNFRQ